MLPIRLIAFAGLSVAAFMAGTGSRAVEVNPRSSAAWIALGLTEEGAGNFAEAEHALLEAARVDRQYLPAWTLANFYFRRADQRAFWPWAQRAAALSYGDLGPLLKLADLLDPHRALGDSPRLDGAYLDFFIREDRLESAQSVARKILAKRAPADVPRLVDFTDRQIRAGDGPAALEIWNGLAEAHLIRFPPIDASHLLTNGKLLSAPTGAGFDWRLPPNISEWRDSRLIFTLSEAEGDAGPLVEQFLLLSGRTYQLHFEYVTAGMPSPTGIRWTLDAQESQPLAPSDSWREGVYTFSAAGRGLGRLRLVYRRDPGTMRADGRLEIRNLRLETL